MICANIITNRIYRYVISKKSVFTINLTYLLLYQQQDNLIMNKQIFVVAELTAQDGKFEEMKQIFEDLAAETRKEKGAIEYFFIEDETKPNTLLSIERWENAVEEAKHWETPHLKNALENASKILVDNKAIIHKGLQVI